MFLSAGAEDAAAATDKGDSSTFGARSAALLFAWEPADEMTHCRPAPQNIIRLCFSPGTSLSGVGEVVGTPRVDIECEPCAKRLSGKEKKTVGEGGVEGGGGGGGAGGGVVVHGDIHRDQICDVFL